jgi:hypothetical protein
MKNNDQLKIINPKTFEKPLCAEVGYQFFYIDDEDDKTVNPRTANSSYTIAIKICHSCVHQTDCAEWGIRKERWGVWGGLTPTDRNRIRKNKNITLDL